MTENLGNLIATEAYEAFEAWLLRHCDLLEDFTLVETGEIYSNVDGKDDLKPILNAALEIARKNPDSTYRPGIWK